MTLRLDGSVYPDKAAPTELLTLAAKADYVQRVCGAFDFGVVPEAYTLDLLESWKEVFDAFPLKSSPAYHALRCLFSWEAVEKLPYLGKPTYVTLDELEGRTDGFESFV